MKPFRLAIFGAGFWSQYQLAAWQALGGVDCVAVYNRTFSRAEALAHRFDIPAVFSDPEELLDRTPVDFIDIISAVETHFPLVALAADRKIPVICQKPMAGCLADAEQMVSLCRKTGTPFWVHENFRWQTPIRQVKRVLDSGEIGFPFRARIHFCSHFPVFENQPFLKELEQFMLTDVGSHILDVARFLFGEATSLYCRNQRIHPDIRGEDVSTVMLTMGDRVSVVCEMSYASITEHERFPQTYIFIEAEKGSLELGPDFWLRVTTESGTRVGRHPPPRYGWADPAYDVVHASILDCHSNLLAAIRGKTPGETTGEDNLETVRLVFGSYVSAQNDAVVHPR